MMQRADLEAEIERNHADGFGWALSCCSWDRTEAEDVLQTAYLKVLDGRAVFGGRSEFRTWLFGVIRRTAAERRRRVRARGRALQRFFERRAGPETAEIEAGPGHSDDALRLVARLRRLPPRQREVLHLVFYQDLSIAGAAEVMGLSVGTARTHYARGKHRLRQELAGGKAHARKSDGEDRE